MKVWKSPPSPRDLKTTGALDSKLHAGRGSNFFSTCWHEGTQHLNDHIRPLSLNMSQHVSTIKTNINKTSMNISTNITNQQQQQLSLEVPRRPHHLMNNNSRSSWRLSFQGVEVPATVVVLHPAVLPELQRGIALDLVLAAETLTSAENLNFGMIPMNKINMDEKVWLGHDLG